MSPIPKIFDLLQNNIEVLDETAFVMLEDWAFSKDRETVRPERILFRWPERDGSNGEHEAQLKPDTLICDYWWRDTDCWTLHTKGCLLDHRFDKKDPVSGVWYFTALLAYADNLEMPHINNRARKQLPNLSCYKIHQKYFEDLYGSIE